MDKVKKLFKKNSGKREKKYGECQTCHRYNTSYSWCQSCGPKLLTERWTSGDETIDEIIKNTQLKATKYDNDYYLQWIPSDELKNIREICKTDHTTLYHATWMNGWKYIDQLSKKSIIKDRDVAL